MLTLPGCHSMDYAYDLEERKTLFAIREDARNKKKLICPCCHKQVHYRRGERRPHFAHNPGEGTEACENYHPSQHQGEQDRNNLNEKSNKLPTLHLNIAMPHFPNWHLEIIISSEIEGKATIKQGLQGKISVALPTKKKAVPVLIERDVYNVEITTLEHSIFKTLNGLSIEAVNLFTHQGERGRRLESNKPLWWCESYFLIWHESYELSIEQLAIQSRVLKTQGDWHCAEIQLPAGEDPTVAYQVEKYLKRHIRIPPPKLVLITPFSNDKAGNIVTKNYINEEVIIGITGNPDRSIQGELKVKRSLLINQLPAIVSLGKLPQRRTTVWFGSGDESDELVLDCVPFQKDRLPHATVRLKIQDNDWPAHSLKIHVIDSYDDLKGIEFPTLMSFSILIQEADLIGSRTFLKPYSEEQLSDFQDRALQKIIAHLEAAKTAIQLDFGNFGQPTLKKTMPAHIDQPLPYEITRQLRWLAGLCWQASTSQKIPKNIVELEKYIHNNKLYLPAIAEIYLRVLRKKLKKLLG